MDPGFLMMIIATLLLALSVAARTRTELRSAVWLRRVFAVMRVVVGAILVLYAVVKFAGVQLHRVDIHSDIATLSSDELFWYFFGYSRVYAFFLAGAELVAGILLVVPVTARFGALAVLAVMVNVTILDFAFDVGPVRFWALGLTVCCVSFVVVDIDRYRDAIGRLTAK